ncbi:MAG: hypothetical protein WC866_03785 [Patescibacteria group bacterium]
MRSTFVSGSLAFLFGLACILGNAGADSNHSAPSNHSGTFLADPASLIYDGTSVVMIGIMNSPSCGQFTTEDQTCSGDAVDSDGDGIFDASSSERRMGELDCSDPRLTGCEECLGTVRICCPSQECTVSNCPGKSGYCPNDKGGGSHCC